MSVAFVASVLAGACGLTAVGTGEPVSALPDGEASLPGPGQEGGPPGDAASSSDGQAAACTSSDTACTSALPAGWTPIAFASDRAAACPAGYTTRDLVVGPSAGSGACACACAINDPPSCAKGSFAGTVGMTMCNSPSVTYTVNGTGCTPIGQTAILSPVAKYAALPLTPGTCTSSVTKDATKVASAAVRACEPSPACAGDVCRGDGLAPFGSCVAHDGDVACPSGPFATKTLTGPSATLTCGGVCGTCTNTATCGAATLHFFNESACANEVATRLVNDACNAVASGTAGATSYFKYDVATMNAVCTPTGTPTAAVALDLPRTICCR